jgi:hypothetical protein
MLRATKNQIYFITNILTRNLEIPFTQTYPQNLGDNKILLFNNNN